jgi:hypothetical protein|tara:strand:+ start:100 stop:654 length:555 start_codon:yes stop_codon:yes gene_type:complete
MVLTDDSWSYDCCMAKKSDLTPKQLKFCRELASGKSKSDAYRASYDVKPSTTAASVNTLSSRLYTKVEIRLRTDQLIAAREQGLQAKALSQRDLVINRLREAVDDDEFGSNRLKALQILAQVSGLMRTDVHLTQEDKRDSATILGDLEKKLVALGVTPEDAAEDDSEPLGESIEESASNESSLH